MGAPMPLCRFGEPSDFAGLLASPVSPDAKRVTDRTIVVDGGPEQYANRRSKIPRTNTSATRIESRGISLPHLFSCK